MKKFELTIFNERRLYLSIIIFLPVVILFSLYIILKFDLYFLYLIFFIIIYCYLIFQFSIGNLKVFVENNSILHFEWKKKMFFNFKKINSINTPEITQLVIDENNYLKKIVVGEKSIKINNAKIYMKDSIRFIDFLKEEQKKYNFEIIDSWDLVRRKGYINVFYYFSIIISIIAILVMFTAIYLGKFESKHFIVLLFFLPQLIFYIQIIKSKKDKKG